MLLYYQSWMFYNTFIVILYHFLVLTYWYSAKCQLPFSACFLHRRKSISDGVQMQRNFMQIYFYQKTHNGSWLHLGVLRGEHNPPRRARRPRRALVGCAHLGCPRTASLLYKYPNIPKTLGESTNIDPTAAESRTTRSNLDTISDGIHHLHWCLSDDAWVVLCRPSGP